MTTGSDLSGLMKFLGRDNWAARFDEVVGEHFGPIMDEFDLQFDEIGALVGEHWAGILWGAAFEDFLTQTFESGEPTFAATYLKRLGWRESTQNKAYIKALGVSVMSLYEISEVVPGVSLLARDVIRGGEAVLVSEKSATQSLRQWEKIAARIIPLGRQNVLSGAVLPMSREAADMITDEFKKLSRASQRKKLSQDEMHAAAAPLFTQAFLLDVLPKEMGLVSPKMSNSDGDDIVFHEVRFPLSSNAARTSITSLLDAVPSFSRTDDLTWNWLTEETPGPRRQPVAQGRTILGTIKLHERFLTLSVNSASRATQGTTIVEMALGNKVRAPLTAIQTFEQARAALDSQKFADKPAGEIPTTLVHNMLDEHYRATLDQPIGMLGNVTPRAAVKTKKGREKVVEWLKHLEIGSAGQADQDPMATYDFGWMWRELNVESLRK
jgi:hypothetical protein